MFLSIKYAGWFMCSKIVEFERYRAISRELLNAQTQDKYQHVAKSLKILLMLILWRLQLVWRQYGKKRQIYDNCVLYGKKHGKYLYLENNSTYKHRTSISNARASFLVHQVPRASAAVWQYRRMFTHFSLRVWASEYTRRSIIANLLYLVRQTHPKYKCDGA